jgi:hypothetical protein
MMSPKSEVWGPKSKARDRKFQIANSKSTIQGQNPKIANHKSPIAKRSDGPILAGLALPGSMGNNPDMEKTDDSPTVS